MNSPLIPLTDNDGVQAVMGRDLHSFLGIKNAYTTWFRDMTEYGFTSGNDYLEKTKQSEKLRGGTIKDHIMSLDMAKEISMIQRTDKGKQARQYFLECERQAKSGIAFQLPATYGEALRELADTTEKVEELTVENTALKGGDGIRIKDFIKTYFTAPNERAIFEWLYFHGYLIDGRLQDDEGKALRSGGGPKLRWDHMHPTYIGRRYFKLVPRGKNPYGGQRTRIIPERALDLVAVLMNAKDLPTQMTMHGREALDEHRAPGQLRVINGSAVS